ncbi:MAG: redox-regulated ATPase YchF [Methanobacteriota archaeon]|nr:MAG: redox-regulated ATPase YchF [Euryarchaeota archaeon]
MLVGIVGKPNVGKSTFFSALTMSTAQVASYPFTTIEANRGVGHVRGPCPHTALGSSCSPNNSLCEGGTRFVPIELLDVAGLVPDAHSGKGLGNKFLDDLRQAHAFIHVVDASGGTDFEGNPVGAGSHDPALDVSFLEREISYWIFGILGKDFNKIARQSKLAGKKFERLLQEKLTGLSITEAQILSAIKQSGNDNDPSLWKDDELLSFCQVLQKVSKPMIIAANKADIAPPENMRKLEETGYPVVPTSAEFELALRRAAKGGLVAYTPGASSFDMPEESKLNESQRKALDKMADWLKGAGSTGVQPVLEKVVFDVLDLIIVYPVEDETKWMDKQGRILPDAYLMPRGSNARDLAFKVHTDLGDNFIRAIDGRTHMAVGHDHILKENDVVKIVARV